MKTLPSLLIVASILTGCATNQSQTQRLADENNKLFTETINSYKDCADKLNMTEAGRIVINEIIVLSPTQPNKYELMTSRAKLMPPQSEALKIYLPQNSLCRQIQLSGFSRIDAGIANALIQYYNKMDAIYVALLNNQFTIGDANVAKEKASQEYQSAFNIAKSQYVQHLQGMNNEAYAQRQRAAAVLLPLMMQQNAINAQNQQNLYNQQMQNIRSTTPVYTPPIQTTCQAVGNQIVCNSR